MDTLEIKKDAAMTAYQNAKKSGKKLLEDLFGKKTFAVDIKEILNNFEDVLEWHGKTKKDFENETNNMDSDVVGYIKAKMIVEAYNEGVKPDYNNPNQIKYEMCWQLGSSSGSVFRLDDYGVWSTDSCCGARLSFLSKENLYDAAEKFEAEFKEFYQNQ